MSQRKRKKRPVNPEPYWQANSKHGSDFQEQCLRNSVILQTIFKELPASDLLSCRLVNKSWYTEANSVMMTLDVALKISSEQPHQQVYQLIELIPEMSLPFNGLSFKKDARQSIECEIQEKPSDLVSKFLQVLPPIKHLHLTESSASEELILRIMKAHASNLESLSFEITNMDLSDEIVIATWGLRNLKRITPKQFKQRPEFFGYSRNVWMIIFGCKSIEVVQDYTFNDLFEVPKHRFSLVKNLMIANSSRWYLQESLLKFVETKPKLESLTFVPHPLNFPPPMMPILCELVGCSKETLTSVEFPPYVWETIARGLLPFEPLSRIRELHKVPVNFSRMTSNQLANFGGFIAYTFPNLKFIEVDNLDFGEEGAGGNYNNFFTDGNKNSSPANSSVTALKFVESQPLQVSLSAVILIAFPNVTNLNVSFREGKLQSVYDLWGRGPDLQSLTISSQVTSKLEMESELLGIFPQEVRRLRKLKLSPSKLRRLQIVPIRPALHHLSGLVDLSIKIRLGRSGIYLLQWHGEGARYTSDFDHNEIIKQMSLGRMRSLRTAMADF